MLTFMQLRLEPTLERQFWRSRVFSRAAVHGDVAAGVVRIYINFLVLQSSRYLTPHHALATWRSSLFGIAVATAKLLCLLFLSPSNYKKLRWTFARHDRIFSVLSTALTALDTCRFFLSNPPDKYVSNILSPGFAQGNVSLHTLRFLLGGTLASTALLHASTTLLPFTEHLFFQSCYLLVIIFAMSSPAATILTQPAFTSATLQACNTLSFSSHFLLRVMFLLPHNLPHPTNPCIHGDAAWILTLFTQLLVGFVVPLYICHSIESYLKTKFLSTLPPSHLAPMSSLLVPTSPVSSPTQNPPLPPSASASPPSLPCQPHPYYTQSTPSKPPPYPTLPPSMQTTTATTTYDLCTGQAPLWVRLSRHVLSLAVLTLASWQLAVACHGVIRHIVATHALTPSA